MRSSFLLLLIALLFTLAQAAAWQQNANSVAATDKAQTAAPTMNNSSDDRLREQVQQQLQKDSALSDVRAEVRNGQLRLTGMVSSQAERERALKLARAVAGIRSIQEHIEVRGEAQAAQHRKESVSGQTAISETSNNTAGSIAGNAGMAGTSLATGQASTPGAMAGNSRSGSSGENPSTIRTAIPNPENEKLRGEIQNTLRNEPSLAGSRLEVNVNDSQIELSGSVPTAREKETARRIARSYGNNRRVIDSKVDVQSGGAQASPQRAAP